MNKLAKSIVDIATGESVSCEKDVKKSKAGKAGGAARAKSLTEERRTEIAKKAAKARWREKAAPLKEEQS